MTVKVSGRSIPAWAGEPSPPYVWHVAPPLAGLSPRGRGNRTRSRMISAALMGGLSPRGRGNLSHTAGSASHKRCEVYPRVGGGTDSIVDSPSVIRGRPVYPRVGGGTGQARSRRPSTEVRRSIPAWAGEPG